MKNIPFSDIKNHRAELIKAIKKGAILLYPTDTVHGIGCNASDKDAVKRLRAIKMQHDRPLSIIAPSKQWIYDNLELNSAAKKAVLEKLPGPYTLILPLKNKRCIAENVTLNKSTLGVRLPDHPFAELIKEAKTPFITTSANLAGQPIPKKKSQLPEEITDKIDYLIWVDNKNKKASTILDFSGDLMRVLRI